jgi:hypothetical protein
LQPHLATALRCLAGTFIARALFFVLFEVRQSSEAPSHTSPSSHRSFQTSFNLATVHLPRIMADDHRGGGSGYAPREPRDPRDTEESQYPPPPGEEDDTRPYLPPVNRPLTLPSIQETYHSSYSTPPPSGRGYQPQHDARAGGAFGPSPPNANGFQTPPSNYPPSLPPVQAADPRQQQYNSDYYNQQQQQRGPYQDPYYGRYPPQGPPHPGYGGYPDYPRVGASVAPQQQQAAPRQRTSIACRYCRKRKVRNLSLGGVGGWRTWSSGTPAAQSCNSNTPVFT